MRVVARYAAVSFYRWMFMYERPGIFRVALDAYLVLRRRRPKLLAAERPMWIVAVRAIHQSFIHAVMEWTIEVWLDIAVARIAQRRLRRGQQRRFPSGVVHGVAGKAADLCVRVCRAIVVVLVMAGLVA